MCELSAHHFLEFGTVGEHVVVEHAVMTRRKAGWEARGAMFLYGPEVCKTEPSDLLQVFFEPLL